MIDHISRTLLIPGAAATAMPKDAPARSKG